VIDGAERASMEETVRRALAAADGPEAVDRTLGELGWLDLLEAEPDDAIEIVFGALGATNAAGTALDDLLATALGEKPRPDLAVLLPSFASWDPPGAHAGGVLRARGLTTRRAASARELLVIRGPASEPSAVTLSTAEGQLRTVAGIDPDGGWHEAVVEGGAPAAVRLDPAAWRSAVSLGRRAAAQQMAGACRAMLGLARKHALERVQFGRPIARFQAVRHRLADTLVAVESLEATLAAAREAPGWETAALAKACACRTLRTTATHCQQVLAGIGFTTEHVFHRFLKRALALEGLFGSADAIALDVGRQLLAERRVPTLIEL
jgi:Acyl-CoA dehydrogenase, C-terminal domain